MHLSITGPPGSGHYQIGKKLAERLELDHYSAKSIAEDYCSQHQLPYYLFKLHEQKDADIAVDTTLGEIRGKAEDGYDMVVDALATKQWEEFDRICIMQDTYADKLKATSLYNEEVREKWFRKDTELFDYGPDTYDICIHRMYLTDDQVVSTIINSIVDGVLKANYIHPYQVLPMYPQSMPRTVDNWLQRNKVFHAKKYGFVFLLDNPDDYNQYRLCLEKGLLLNLEIEDVRPTVEDRRTNSDYDWLSRFMPQRCFDTLMLSYMLAKYAAVYEVDDITQVYLDLSKNANPIKRLREAGFDK